MDRRLVRQVLRHLDRGDRVLFGFDHFGAVRIKVKHGPFNLFSTHHRTDQETFNAIQHELALVGHEDIGKNKIVYTEAPEPPLTAAKPERTRRPSRRRKARPFKQNGVRSEPPPPDPGEPEQRAWIEASVAHLGVRLVWLSSWGAIGPVLGRMLEAR